MFETRVWQKKLEIKLMKTRFILIILLIFNGLINTIAQKEQFNLVLPLGHTSPIKSTSFNADESMVMTLCGTELKIWDAKSHRLIRSLINKNSYFSKAEFGINKNTVITFSEDNLLKIWDFNRNVILDSFRIETYVPLNIPKLDDSPFNERARMNRVAVEIIEKRNKERSNAYIFPKENKLIVITKDLTIFCWSISKKKKLFEINKNSKFKNPESSANSLAMKGPYLLESNTLNNSVNIWNSENGLFICSLSMENEGFPNIVFNEDNYKVITWTYNQPPKIWDAKTGELLKTLTGDFSTNMRSILRFDKSTIAALSTNCDFLIHWNALNGELIDTTHFKQFIDNQSVKDYEIYGFVKIKKDLNNLLLANNLKVLIYNISKKEVTGVFKGRTSPNLKQASLSFDNNFLVTLLNNIVHVWDIKKNNYLPFFRNNLRLINSISMGRNDSLLFVSDAISSSIWNLNNSKNEVSLKNDLYDNSYEKSYFYDDSKKIISVSDSVKIWDAKTGNKIVSIKQQIDNKRAFISEDCQKVIINYVSSMDYTSAGIWDLNTYQFINKLEDTYFPRNPLSFPQLIDSYYSPDCKFIVLYSNDNKIQVYNASTFKKWAIIRNSSVMGAFSPDSKIFATAEDNIIRVWDLDHKKVLYSLKGHNNRITSLKFSYDGSKLFSFSDDFSLKIWDVRKQILIHGIDGMLSIIKEASFDVTGNKLIVGLENGGVEIYDVNNGRLIIRNFVFDDYSNVSLTDGNFFMGDPKASSMLNYTKGIQSIGFEQLDIKYNRPDKVLTALGEAFGNPDTLLINSYYRAWQKRVQKLGIDTTSFEEGFNVPESDFTNRAQIEYEQKGNQLTLKIWGKDADYKLDRYNVWVNEVPLFGQRGVNIRDKNLNELNTTITITLSEGDNKIETSVLNVNGIESYRIPLYLRYTPPQPTSEKIYFIGVGVDQYQQPGHNLQYSAKDIRDLVKQLKIKYGSSMEIDTLFDEKVTRENILALKGKLLQTTVNDKVIVSFSGHGILDNKYDYYLATHKIDFLNPSNSGLPYEDVEWLLDSIPARKKLLLMDACHSGEVDKEGLLAMNTTIPNGTKGVQLVYEYKPTLGMKNSFELMQELFTNVNRGTGATVISAAGGTQFAYEKGNLKNGVFTYSILELMQQKKEIKISELKSKVGERVTQLTNGLQKPNSRNETIEFDWRVW